MLTQQTKIDSIMEAVCNVAVGTVVSFAATPVISWLNGVQMDVRQAAGFVGMFTVTSIARQYALRRAFDGRSVWESLKCGVKSST